MNEKRVVKAGIGYTVGNYLLKGLSFLTVPLFSRMLNTSDYAIFNTYLAYQGIMFLLVGIALHTSLKNAKYRYGKEFDTYNSNCIYIMIVSLVGWLLFTNVFYSLYGNQIGFSRFIVNILLLDSFGTALIQFFNAYVGLDYRYDQFLKIAAFNALGNVGISIVFICSIFKNQRAAGRIIGNALPVILIAVFLIYYFWKKQKPNRDKEQIQYAVKYSIPLVPHGISQVILSQFDRIMIKNIIGNAEAGIYSFGYNIFSIINVTSNSLENVWGPWFYEQMEKKDYGTIREKSSKYAFGMLLFSSMVMLGTPEMVQILGARDYWDAKYTVIPIVVGGYFMFLYSLPSSVEYYYEKTKYIALGTGGAAVINIFLNLWFVPRYGYVAAAYTTLVTYVLYFAFHYYIAMRVHGRCIFDTFRLMLYSSMAIMVGFLTLYLMQYRGVRWGILGALGIATGIWLEREFRFIDFLKKKIHKK